MSRPARWRWRSHQLPLRRCSCAADGGVFTFGDAEFKGSMAAGLLNGRIVGMMPQGGDVRAPVLRHLSFGPTKIDTSNGPAMIKFRANITDDLSGHGVDPPSLRGEGETQVIFANPAGRLTHLGLNVFFRDSDRIAGDRLDGIYRSYGVVRRTVDALRGVVPEPLAADGRGQSALRVRH